MAAPAPNSPAAAGASSSSHANTPTDATRRIRTSRPKVKTGCSNCKQRRIKCDEKRPACSQCVRSRKECTGYPPPPRSARPFEEVLIAPKPARLAAAPGTRAPTVVAREPNDQPPHRQLPHPPPLLSSPSPQPLQPLQLCQPQATPQGQPPSKAPLPLASRAPLPQRRAQKQQQRRSLSAQAPVTAAPTNATASGVTMLYRPSAHLRFTEQEGQYFQLFRLQTANELSGFFDDVFWSRIVLVECHSEAAIRHAVVALGALYKTLETTTESPPTSPADGTSTTYSRHDNARGHWQVALKQYSDACTELAGVYSDDDRTQRTRLMASILLACFDSFIGHHKHAIRQIQTGLGLLHQLRVGCRARLTDAQAAREPVEDELLQMFTRLAIQAKSYDMAFHFPQPYVIHLLSSGKPTAAAATSPSVPGVPGVPGASEAPRASSLRAQSPDGTPPLPTSTYQDAMPAQFASLRQARLAWDALCEHIFRFMEVMMQYAHGPPNLLPKSMQRYGVEFKLRMEAWSNAFEPLLLGRLHPGISSQEKTGIAVLKMFQIMGQVLYAMTFSDSEMMFDAFQQQFRAIVDLAGEVVGDQERRAAAARCPDPTRCVHHSHEHDLHGLHTNYVDFHTAARHIKASFSADLGIVPPLYVVATKSRDRILRRQAIELLCSSARREGMWDSELAARIGMWVVDIEEEGEEAEFYEALQRSQGSHGSQGTTGQTARRSQSASDSNSPSSLLDPASRSSSIDFGTMPLGPGGNARWDARRANQASVLHTTTPPSGQFSTLASPPPAAASAFSTLSAPLDPSLPYYLQTRFPIPAEKRVLVKACEFDLREHTAVLQCGTRGLAVGAHDTRTRSTHLKW